MKIKQKDMFCLICDDSKFAPKDITNRLICGIYATRKEAQVVSKEIKDCLCLHSIKKCTVTVEI